MTRLLAEDLVLLCWRDRRGKPDSACANTLAVAIAGALVVDALCAGAVAIENGRVRPTGQKVVDPLVAEIQTAVRSRRRPPTVETLIHGLGAWNRALHGRPVDASVIARLVDTGVLGATRGPWAGFLGITPHPVVDLNTVTGLRQAVRAVLISDADPGTADRHHRLLAALTEPAGAIPVLVGRPQRRVARRRANAFAEHYEVPLNSAMRSAIVEPWACRPSAPPDPIAEPRRSGRGVPTTVAAKPVAGSDPA